VSGLLLAAARRLFAWGGSPPVSPGLASPFLLLAQKKGTKEDGLNTI